MTTTNERIKKLRKALDLTQQEFADRIGSKRNTVATYEMGRSTPSAAVVTLICKTFNVNEEWLRTGEGDMFNATPETLVDRLAQDYGLDEVGYRIMAAYLKLDERDRLAVGQLIQNLVDQQAADQVEPAPWEEGFAAWEEEKVRERLRATPPDQRAQWEREADEFAAIAREQYLSEKRQALQASSAKESDSGGVA